MDTAAVGDTKSGVDLVRRIRDGDQQAEEELIRLYSRGVSIIIRREVNNAAVVEDLLQEMFRIALEKIRRGDVREPEKLSGFVCGIARNLTISHFRRASHIESLSEIEETRPLPDPAPNPFDELYKKEIAGIVRQVINEMKSERDRQALLRFYIAEEPKEKICADLELTSLHFNRVLFRARERFRELYEKNVGKHQPG